MFAPYNSAWTDKWVGLNQQIELVRNPDEGGNIKSGAGLRQVSNGAAESGAFELDDAALQHATSITLAIFCHLFRPFGRGIMSIV